MSAKRFPITGTNYLSGDEVWQFRQRILLAATKQEAIRIVQEIEQAVALKVDQEWSDRLQTQCAE